MRKDNQPDLSLNRATLTLSAHNYDRRALDTNSPLPLTHTCIQLASQLRASPALCTTLALHDGGLDRLLHLVESVRPTDARLALLWITAYNALATLVCQGSDACKVEAAKKGVLRIALVVVSNYVRQLEANVAATTSAGGGSQPVAVAVGPAVIPPSPTVIDSPTSLIAAHAAPSSATTPLSSPIQAQDQPIVVDVHQEVHQAVDPMLASSPASATSLRRRISISSSTTPADSQVAQPQQAAQLPSTTTAFHLSRHQDMLLTLQILAAMIHLPAVRAFLRQPQPQQAASSPTSSTWCGLSLLEPLTRAESVPATLKSLAVHLLAQTTVLSMPADKDAHIVPGTCCANLACRAIESSATPFSRCSRCKCARYCSRACQVSAWASGHRFWCEAAGAKVAHVAAVKAKVAAVGPYARPAAQQAAAAAARSGSDRVARMRAAAQQAAAAAGQITPLGAFQMANGQMQA